MNAAAGGDRAVGRNRQLFPAPREEYQMAYAEKRGKGTKPWRVKYRRPDGSEGSESGFETKAAALRWGRDQEASISAGSWTDPDAGKMLVSEWIEYWQPAQDVGLSTTDTRGYLIRRFILPAWRNCALPSAPMRSAPGRRPSRPAPGCHGVLRPMPAACCARSWAMRSPASSSGTTRRCGPGTAAAEPAASWNEARSAPG